MKKRFSLLMILVLLVIAVMTSPVFAEDKDKYDRWIGPYNGVYYRYGWSYLGENQWCPYQDFVQFWNGNSSQVKITYVNILNGSKRGPYVQFLQPSNDNDPGIRVAICDGEEVRSIAVEVQ